ncbi:MAG TPA: hypothetical protein VEA78_11225, partial [Acidimicrobiales bacterium]|nr:hypothetical protein [Acidimicrobiales bacterium]
YGDLDIEGEPDVRVVADAAEAEAETGLEVPVVDELPRGVSGEPTYRAGREVVATFTYDADRAGDDSAPPGVDGSSIRLVAGPGVAAAWRASSGAPAMIVGRAIAPSAESTSGVPFEVLRDHLLALPAVPDDVAASLRTFNDSTLPLPVPEDRFRTSSADVGGATATVVESIDRTIAAVVWVHEGIAHVVAGSLDVDEVLDVARGLR